MNLQEIFKGNISEQLALLIMIRIHEDIELQKEGVTVDNMVNTLAENRKLWYEVGNITDSKDYKKRLAWILSGLVKVNALIVNEGKYYPKKEDNFEKVLRHLIYDVSKEINLQLDFSGYNYNDAAEINSKKDILDFMIESNNIELFVQDYNEDKKIHLFTWNQLKEIARLKVVLELEEFKFRVDLE